MQQLEIAVYRARPGMRARMHEVSQNRLPILRRLGYVTDRSEQRWSDQRTMIETLEWSGETSEVAMMHPDIRALSFDMAEVADITMVSDLAAAEALAHQGE